MRSLIDADFLIDCSSMLVTFAKNLADPFEYQSEFCGVDMASFFGDFMQLDKNCIMQQVVNEPVGQICNNFAPDQMRTFSLSRSI